jgi:hypothetical protein
VFGINSLDWKEINAALGGAVPGRRFSQSGSNRGVPRAWHAQPSTVQLTVASSNPQIAPLLAGELDQVLYDYAATIPAGQVVAIHHEGEARQYGRSPATVRAIQEHCYPIFKKASPNCRYVQIITTYSWHSRGSQFGEYLSPVVDAIYMDGYQNGFAWFTETVSAVFGDVTNAIRQAVGDRMPLGIAECNSNFPSQRPSWFADSWSFAVDQGFEIFFAWFKQQGNFRLGWLPGDTATIQVLRNILEQSMA